MRSIRSALTASVCAVSLLSSPIAAEHRDERIGFSFDPPRGWTEIPIPPEEAWLVAKYLSDKKDFFTDPDQGWSYTHQPQVQVIVFLDQVINAADYEQKEGEKAEVRVRMIEPYRDYKDYMSRTFSEGFYFSKEETLDHKGMQVTVYEIKVEKQARSGPKRIVTWVFPLEVGAVAVQVDVLENSFEKSQSLISKVMKSFKVIERTQGLNLEARTGDYVSFSMLADLTVDQRAIRRREMERLAWQKATQGLPDGWEAKAVNGVNIVTREDMNHAKKVAERIAAVRKWLEEAFPTFGQGEYARTPIVRVCGSPEEEMAFRQSAFTFGGMGLEITTHKSSLGATSSEWGYVNQQAMNYWLQDKDQACYFAMPAWLNVGLGSLIENADVKGGKLKFKEDEYERFFLKEALKDGTALTIRELMLMPRHEIDSRADSKDYRPLLQSVALAAYLVEKDEALMGRYLASLHDVMTQMAEERAAARKATEGDAAAATEKKPQTEEEEEAEFRVRREAVKAQEQRILQLVFEKTFGGWTDREWSALEAGYRKSM